MAEIRVNGKPHPHSEGMTVASLLVELQSGSGMMVVELNGEIVARDCFEATRLNEGDALEIVHFVGGG